MNESLFGKKEKLLVIDGNNIARRANAVNKDIFSVWGSTGTIFGFLRSLSGFLKRTSPDYCVIVWDGGRSKRRMEINPNYKMNRLQMEYDKDYFRQVKVLRDEIIPILGVNQVREVGVEADDLIFLLKKNFIDSGKVDLMVIVSGDKDFYQLVDDKVSILKLDESGKEITIDNFEEMTGYKNPDFYKQCKVLIGDSSDGIKGIPCVGEVRAKELIEKYETVDNLLSKMEDFGKLRWVKNIFQNEERIEDNKRLLWLDDKVLLDLEGVDLKDKKYQGSIDDKKVKSALFKFQLMGLLTEYSDYFYVFRQLKPLL